MGEFARQSTGTQRHTDSVPTAHPSRFVFCHLFCCLHLTHLTFSVHANRDAQSATATSSCGPRDNDNDSATTATGAAAGAGAGATPLSSPSGPVSVRPLTFRLHGGAARVRFVACGSSHTVALTGALSFSIFALCFR